MPPWDQIIVDAIVEIIGAVPPWLVAMFLFLFFGYIGYTRYLENEKVKDLTTRNDMILSELNNNYREIVRRLDSLIDSIFRSRRR